MAFPTTRQDHVHDSVKSILYADPNLGDEMSATKLLKQRRKDEARQLYYQSLPLKEQRDSSRGVLTNMYHQQLDVKASDTAGMYATSSGSAYGAGGGYRHSPQQYQQQQQQRRSVSAAAAPLPTSTTFVPSFDAAGSAASGRPEVLVTNLVGGKYYGNRGPLMRDLGFGTRGLGHRRDQISALDGQPVGAATGTSYDDHYGSTARRSASAGGFGADGIRRNPITGAPVYPVNGVLRTPDSLQTMNMQYGSHTKQFVKDHALIDSELGRTRAAHVAGNPSSPHEPRTVNSMTDTYDAAAAVHTVDFQKPIPQPAPWSKASDYHHDQTAHAMYPPTVQGTAVTVPSPVSKHGGSNVLGTMAATVRAGQDKQNYVAPSASIGAVPPAKRQTTALNQPNRFKDPSGNTSYLQEHTRSAAAAVAHMGTHSNNYAARRPDPASDLVNCETGATVHHRGVGVTEDAFRPAFISHEGAHDKTVQRGGWMLSGRDANRNYVTGAHDKATLTAANPSAYSNDLPSKADMQQGYNVIREEDPRNVGAPSAAAPLHAVRFGDEGASDYTAARRTSEAAEIYPPPHAQQQHYHDAGTSADDLAAVSASNPASNNNNPTYWNRIHSQFATEPRHAANVIGGSSTRYDTNLFARSASAGGKRTFQPPAATGTGTAIATRATLPYRSNARPSSASQMRPSPQASAVRNRVSAGTEAQHQHELLQPRPMIAAAAAAGGSSFSGNPMNTVGLGGINAVPRSNSSASTSSRFRNRPVDTMMRLF